VPFTPTIIENALCEELLRVTAASPLRLSGARDWSPISLPDLGLDSMSAIDLVIDIKKTFLRHPLSEDRLVREMFVSFPALEAAVRSVAGSR